MLVSGVGLVLVTFCVAHSLSHTNPPVVLNTTQIGDGEMYKPHIGAVRVTGLKTLPNCSFIPKFPDVRSHIASLAVENKLVKINVNITGELGVLNDTYPVSVYKPHKWIISTSLTGNSMLMLKEYFNPMSLWTLGSGVASASLTLIQEPDACLKGAKVENIENTLRLQFLNNFGADDSRLAEAAVICNAQVIKEGDYGRIEYVCCSRTLNNMLECSVLRESVWFQLLFISISIVQTLAILYSPNLMPDSLYKAGNLFLRFLFKIEAGKVLKMNVMKITEKRDLRTGFVKIMQHDLSHLKTLKSRVKSLTPGKLYTMYIEGVDLDVRRSNIIAEGNAPVSVMRFLRKFFVRCYMRFEVSSVAGCCDQDMCIHLPCKSVFRWYQCMKFIMTLVMAACISSPWLLRVWFYYEHEQDLIQYQIKVLHARNLTSPYTGSMLSYLSPTHSLYIGIYILIIADCILYTFLPQVVKLKLKFTVGQCIRDMRRTQTLDACGFFMSRLLWPLQKFGLLGLLILPLWFLILPLCLLYLALEVFPVANLSVRLLVNAAYYTTRIINPNAFDTSEERSTKKGPVAWIKNRLMPVLVVRYEKTNKRSNQIIQAISLLLTLVTMWGFLFIAADCISFYVECAVYALVGFILNPGDTMKYVSLILLIAVYGNDCFSGVFGKYAAYSKAINREVQTLVGSRLNEEAAKPEAEQENVAFRVLIPDLVSERIHLEVGTQGYLKWRAHRLVLLLDKADIPYIPKNFLFEMGLLKHDYCPGKIHLLYLYALLDFSLIIVFLMFVFIVIFAFGQAHDISSGGQTVAALGSGFLPLILRKFLFTAHSGSGIDGSNLRWKNMFANAVRRFASTWNVTDIHVTHIQETDTDNSDRTFDNFQKIGNKHDSDSAATNSRIDETGIKLLPRSSEITEDNLRGNIDLIVKSTVNNKGEEVMSFYVPDNSFKDSLTDVNVVVTKGPEEETNV